MKLISETLEDVKYITEAKEDGGKNLYIEGIFLQSSIKNRNGRMYPEETMDREVARYMKESVESNSALGELGHPNGPQINLDRVSHRIVSLRKEGTDYIGKAIITNTPMGNIAKGLLKSGASLGVSSRGMGSLKPDDDGVMVVQPDFHLATAADIVADPSAPEAFVKGVMENVDWVYDALKDTWYQEKLHETKKILKELSMDDIERTKLGIFENFMHKISSKTIII